MALALMLLAHLPVATPIGPVRPALAQDACGPSADRILQDICRDEQTRLNLMEFEEDTVNGWLTAHQMPLSDAGLIYQHGRSDLRSVLRAQMLARILGIIHQSERTANEQFVYDWFSQVVHQHEVGVYQFAVDERDRWESDPCGWRPDPDIAAAYGLYYQGGAFCRPNPLSAVVSTKPQVPSKSYFLTAGRVDSYGKKIAESPDGGRVLSETSEHLLTSLSIASIPAAVSAAGISALVGIFHGVIFAGAAGVSKSVAAISISAASAATGVLVIVLFAVLVGVTAGFELFEAQDTLDELATLDADLANAQSTPPDLRAMAHTAEGQQRLTQVFVAETLPEFSSTSTLPVPGNDDSRFLLTPGGLSSTLTYRDWEGDVWTATPYHGFFVQEGTEAGNPVTSLSPVIRYLQPSEHPSIPDVKLTAVRVGPNFLVTKGDPDKDDVPCAVNPLTGVTDPADIVPTCSSYVVSEIQFRDGDGLPRFVTLNEPPAFTSQPTTTFTDTVAKQFEVTATGAPAPQISISSGLPLPTGFTFEDSSVAGAGKAKLIYDGTSTPTGSYPVTFLASGFPAVEQDFTIVIGDNIEITSTDMPTFTAGKFGEFLITTSGSPAPAIDFTGVACLPSGLSLSDNGDGTATVSGTATVPSAGVILVCPITADNGTASDTQNLKANVLEPPPAHFTSGDDTTFYAGVLNSFEFSTAGAETPVTIDLPCNDEPGFVSFNDHGDGTATLHGNPGFGTDGSFAFRVRARVLGEAQGIINCDPNFTLYVSNVPTFLGPDRFAFGPPPITGAVFNIETNQNSGDITQEGELPDALTFTDEEDGSARISGIPDVGTGGVYPLVFSMTNAAGTGTQLFRLQVIEAPGFQTFDSTVFYVGQDNSFPVQTSGFPKVKEEFENGSADFREMEIGVSGVLPPGVSFTDANELGIRTGTGLLHGIPEAGSEGAYPLTLSADNGVGGVPTMHDFTLFVVQPGDVNRDGVVDERDFDEIQGSLGITLGDPDYDHLIDTNNDGIIDALDLEFVSEACPDPDGDGACESEVDDRDGDGIPDAEDYDPSGYLYDQDTGEILTGGSVSVTPAPLTFPFDGSDGFYAFTYQEGGLYTLTVTPPPSCGPAACPSLDPPPYDPMESPVFLGSSEDGATGTLASSACADNPYSTTFQLSPGDEVFLNNFPFACAPSFPSDSEPVPTPASNRLGLVFLALALALFGLAALRFRRPGSSRRKGGRN